MALEKSWQARIGQATDSLAQSFVESMSYDWRLYKADVAGSIAHATMLAKVGLISGQDRDAIVKGLKEIESEIDRDGPKWPGFKPELEDIHMCVEAELIARIGEPGRRLHTGRSRNDQVAFDLKFWLESAHRDLRPKLRDLVRSFVLLADRNGNVVMPSFTHLQRAQPILSGAEALAWAEMFERDFALLDDFQSYVTTFMPLGSGAIAGSSLPIDPSETSWQLASADANVGRKLSTERKEELARKFVPHNSIEHTATRDHALDLVYLCSRISMHLSRWAEQWIIYMSTEFGFIKIADRYTTSSSMMPQKRNPDMLELIRGRCGNVYGDLVALLTILKGLPIGYNRDLQEDKRILFRAYDTTLSCVTMAAAIVDTAHYRPEIIEPTLDRGFLDATSLAEYFVTKGIPFRTAHQIVGALVARCENEGKHSLTQLKLDDFITAAQSAGAPTHNIGPDVFQSLGAKNVVNRYQSHGAAGGQPFEDQLQSWKDRLNLTTEQ